MKKILLIFLTLMTGTALHPGANAGNYELIYEADGKQYRYSIVQSGDNYNYEFENGPENTMERLKAGVHILRTLYDDNSIELEKREGYIRERANCSLFEGGLYNYTFCIFPNEFSTADREVFRGYVAQLPNWKWMVIWNLLPVALLLGLIFYFTRK